MTERNDMKTGTLKELNVKPGDVVECLMWFGDMFVAGKEYAVSFDGRLRGECKDGWVDQDYHGGTWIIVSRAAAAPKLWRDMTPEEKGALLLAAHEGRVVECWYQIAQKWVSDHKGVGAFGGSAYRIRPEPKRETVALCWKKGLAMQQIGTIDLINGKPVPGSVKLDEI
jgi:hypothetical protein